MRGLLLLLAAALVFFGHASGAAAQSAPEGDLAAAPGWVLTPSLVFSTSRDNNVLVRGATDNPQGDVLNVINPRASLDYRGRRSQFAGTYDGAMALYHNFSNLNMYDQRSTVRASHRLSPHLSLFAGNTVAVAPTTELLQLAGVPFVRTGSSLDELSGGVEAQFTKRTSMNASAQFQWVKFDEARPVDLLLRGGHSRGASARLEHRLSARTTVTGDYSLQRAVVANGQARFNVQNSSVGVEHTVTKIVQVFGGGGISHLGLSAFGPARTGPSYRAGLNVTLQNANVVVSYNRAFVPSFAFGGTMENEDLSTQLRVTLSPRAYAQSSFSWRRNDPLTVGELNLRSRWLQISAGYTLLPWAQIEGFYGALFQTINRPGGMADRTRIGFQIVTSQPMRLR